jgi:hypothetical protein
MMFESGMSSDPHEAPSETVMELATDDRCSSSSSEENGIPTRPLHLQQVRFRIPSRSSLTHYGFRYAWCREMFVRWFVAIYF